MTTVDDKQSFDLNGYLLARGLFTAEEAEFHKAHYMAMRERGVYEGDFAGVDLTSSDPLMRYPRMIHMHRRDEVSLEWLIDARLNEVMTRLLGREPFAVQTMLYFKP